MIVKLPVKFHVWESALGIITPLTLTAYEELFMTMTSALLIGGATVELELLEELELEDPPPPELALLPVPPPPELEEELELLEELPPPG